MGIGIRGVGLVLFSLLVAAGCAKERPGNIPQGHRKVSLTQSVVRQMGLGGRDLSRPTEEVLKAICAGDPGLATMQSGACLAELRLGNADARDEWVETERDGFFLIGRRPVVVMPTPQGTGGGGTCPLPDWNGGCPKNGFVAAGAVRTPNCDPAPEPTEVPPKIVVKVLKDPPQRLTPGGTQVFDVVATNVGPVDDTTVAIPLNATEIRATVLDSEDRLVENGVAAEVLEQKDGVTGIVQVRVRVDDGFPFGKDETSRTLKVRLVVLVANEGQNGEVVKSEQELGDISFDVVKPGKRKGGGGSPPPPPPPRGDRGDLFKEGRDALRGAGEEK
jgi:hypothetical protein